MSRNTQENSGAQPSILHPLVVRVTHWVNALAMLLMITSGWRIYNASPIFGFTFPSDITLGGWLAGALQWHFAAMWLLVLNGLVYFIYGLVSGRWRMNLLPLSLHAIWADTRAALAFKLEHEQGTYNAVQKLLYLGVLILGVLVVLSGLAIWKPVQFHLLTFLFGGYDFARIVHFVCMSGIVAFVIVHITLALIVPSTLLPMITGRAARLPKKAAK